MQTEKVKGQVTFLAKDVYESLNFLIISVLRKAGNPRGGLPAFYCLENSDEGGVLTKTTR